MERPEQSVKLFEEGASCAQAILMVYGPLVGLSSAQSTLIGSGLGGGIGRRQYICGAINAGAIVIGLRFGNTSISDNEGKELGNRTAGEFVIECETAIGGSQCSALLGIDLNSPDQKALAKESGLFEKVCNNAVRHTAEILEKYITTKG